MISIEDIKISFYKGKTYIDNNGVLVPERPKRDPRKYKDGCKMDIHSLKWVLDRQYDMYNTLNKPFIKRTEGCIYPYVSGENIQEKYNIDGGLLITDIDKIPVNVADDIYNNAEKIFETIPNILAICFSASHCIHIFSYDPQLKGDIYNQSWGSKNRDDSFKNEFEYRSKIQMCLIAYAIKMKIGIDLNNYPKSLDERCCNPLQQLYIAPSPYKYNPYWTEIKIDKKEEKKLKGFYNYLFKKGGYSQPKYKGGVGSVGGGSISYIKNGSIGDYDINPWVPRNITGDTPIPKGLGGYAKRGAVYQAFASLCEWDKYKTDEMIYKYFDPTPDPNKELSGAEQICAWSPDQNYFDQRTFDWLFKKKDNTKDRKVIDIEDGQYLSDVVNLDEIKNKYIYITAPTGCGKSSFIRNQFAKGERNLYIQLNKALAVGLSQEIQNETILEYDEIFDGKKNIHTRLEVFNSKIDEIGFTMEEATVWIDESHLIQEYINMKEKAKQIDVLLRNIEKAKRVIFLSATPKADKELFDFFHIEIRKKKDQILTIYPVPITGAKIKDAVYDEVVDMIKNFKSKTVIFSDKKRAAWDEALTRRGVEFGVFNSASMNVDKTGDMNSILKDNKMLSKVVLATKYLGVGIEIKSEEEVNVLLDLYEGYDMDYINQCVGRFRVEGDEERGLCGCKKINLYLLYRKDSNNRFYMSEEDKEEYNNVLEEMEGELVEEMSDEEERINYNIAKIFNAHKLGRLKCPNKILKMKLAYLWSQYSSLEVCELFRLYNLPYKQMPNIITLDEINVSDKKTDKVIIERELKSWIKTLDWTEQCEVLEKKDSELIERDLIPFKNAADARKVLGMWRKINSHKIHWNDEVEEVLGSMNTVTKTLEALDDYIRLMRENPLYEFKDPKDRVIEIVKAEEEWKRLLKVESMFREDYINMIAYTKYEDFSKSLPLNEIFNSMDEVFKDIIGENGCIFEFYDDKPVDIRNILNESDERVNTGNKIGGKIGGKIGSPAKKIMVTENLKRAPKKLKTLKKNDKKTIKEGTIFESISKLIEYSGYTNYQVQKMIKEGIFLYVND